MEKKESYQKLTNLIASLEKGKPSRPSRGKLCIIATVLGFFISLGGAVFFDLVHQVKNDPSKADLLKGK